MTSASGNEALDKGHAIRQRLSKAIQHSIGTVELGKFVRYIESSLYQTPRFNEFSKKQPKCSLYRGIHAMITLQNPAFPDVNYCLST